MILKNLGLIKGYNFFSTLHKIEQNILKMIIYF